MFCFQNMLFFHSCYNFLAEILSIFLHLFVFKNFSCLAIYMLSNLIIWYSVLVAHFYIKQQVYKMFLGQRKRVTIFHAACVKCNYRRKTPNGYQKFDITEKTIILNFYYYKLKRFYNRDPFFWDWLIFMIFH